MQLKRLYNHDTDPPTVRGVKVLRAGPVQHFSPDFLTGAEAEGWLERKDGTVVIRGEDGLVVYQIVREPGRYEDGVINYFDCVKVE